MADTPIPILHFGARARREVELPAEPPRIGDDFDWNLRDFESFRRFMLEELAARFPQRRRWTSSDLEVVLVEALAAVLDQISDKLDRVVAEQVLETARRPESVRRLLGFIGYDAVREAGLIDASAVAIEELERNWSRKPELMDAARRAGPRSVHRQRRMVGLGDYGRMLERHPLVHRARAGTTSTAGWTRMRIAVAVYRGATLDQRLASKSSATNGALVIEERLWTHIRALHDRLGLRIPPNPTVRSLLEQYVNDHRMVAHEIDLCEPEYVPLELGFEVRVASRYFRSEVELAIRQALSTDPGGYFERKRLDFGQGVYYSDLIECLMSLDGVEDVVIRPFQRADHQISQAGVGEIRVSEHEIGVCDDDPDRPDLGHYDLVLQGGRTG